MEDEKKCNCKAKKNANKLINNINEINKSKSRDYKKRKDKLYINFLKYTIYIVFIVILSISIFPLIIYLLITKKSITLKLPFKNNKNGRHQQLYKN